MLYGPDRCLSDCYICHLWEGKRGIRGEQSEQGRGGARRGGAERSGEERRGDGLAGEGGSQWKRACVRVRACVCVSLADLLVRKQIFSLSDSINLPHLS